MTNKGCRSCGLISPWLVVVGVAAPALLPVVYGPGIGGVAEKHRTPSLAGHSAI